MSYLLCFQAPPCREEENRCGNEREEENRCGNIDSAQFENLSCVSLSSCSPSRVSPSSSTFVFILSIKCCFSSSICVNSTLRTMKKVPSKVFVVFFLLCCSTYNLVRFSHVLTYNLEISLHHSIQWKYFCFFLGNLCRFNLIHLKKT